MVRFLNHILLGMFILLTPCNEPARADVFQWTDERGIRHFSNISPPGRGKVSRVEERLRGLRPGTRFTVIRVFDGDTIKVRGAGLTFKVRLVGIDAPETGWKGQAGQPFAVEAKQALTRMVLGKTIGLKQYGTGGYNRILAEVFAGPDNINLYMVKQGLAEIYGGRLPSALETSAYTASQDLARRNRAGVWSLGQTYKSPRDWRRENPRQ